MIHPLIRQHTSYQQQLRTAQVSDGSKSDQQDDSLKFADGSNGADTHLNCLLAGVAFRVDESKDMVYVCVIHAKVVLLMRRTH